MLKSLILFTVASLATLFIAGCRQSAPRKPVVTVSIDPQARILSQIAGDKVEVNVLLPGESNPETFDPPIAVLRKASGSSAYLRMGHLPWEESLIERLREGNDTLRVFDTSEGIEPVMDSHSHRDADGHEEPAADPHTWASLVNARVIAANMLSALLTIDPANAATYRSNHARLDARLDSIHRKSALRLRHMEGKAFVVWHPSLSYFARDYGLEQIAMETDGKELTPAEMQKRIDHARQKQARVVFTEPGTGAREKAELVAGHCGAIVVTIHPMAGNWDEEMERIVNILAVTSDDYDEGYARLRRR